MSGKVLSSSQTVKSWFNAEICPFSSSLHEPRNKDGSRGRKDFFAIYQKWHSTSCWNFDLQIVHSACQTLVWPSTISACLFVLLLFSVCRKPNVTLTHISKRLSFGSGDLKLTPKPLHAMVTSQAVYFCPDLYEYSGKQLHKWSCSCNQIRHCVQTSPMCRLCPVL